MMNYWEMNPKDRDAYLKTQMPGWDPRGNNEMGAQVDQWMAANYPVISGGFQFAGEMAKRRQRGILDLLAELGPAGQVADVAAFGAGADENAAKSATSANMQSKALGLGDGFQAGQVAGAHGKAAEEKNAYLAEQQSPANRIRRAAMMLQAMEGGMNIPLLGDQMGLANFKEMRHRQNQSEVGSGSFAKTLGSFAGLATGAGWNPFGGGASSGGQGGGYTGYHADYDPYYGWGG